MNAQGWTEDKRREAADRARAQHTKHGQTLRPNYELARSFLRHAREDGWLDEIVPEWRDTTDLKAFLDAIDEEAGQRPTRRTRLVRHDPNAQFGPGNIRWEEDWERHENTRYLHDLAEAVIAAAGKPRHRSLEELTGCLCPPEVRLAHAVLIYPYERTQ